MRKLAIGLGGDHLLAEDLEVIQNALFESTAALGRSTGQTFIALYGVVQSDAGGFRSWTAGWVLINGELCQVDAGSFASHPNNTWNIVETNDAAGQETYQDATVQQTYKLRKAAITNNAGGPTQWNNLKYFADYYANKTEEWQFFTTILGGAWGDFIAKFRKNKAFEVQVIGELNVAAFSGSGSDDIIADLPIGYSPGNPIIILCPAIINAARTQVHVEITAIGQLKPKGLVAGDAVQIFFNHTFPTDF